MKAITVVPGRPGSIALRDVPPPDITAVHRGRGVLVEVLRVGVDATDLEIAEGKYGATPQGDDYLVLGHESLGRVVGAGEAVPQEFAPGSLVVATVRRPGGSLYDRLGMPDLTTDTTYFERGISRLHGFLCERYVEDYKYLVPLPPALCEVGVLLEPTSVSQKGIRQAFEMQRRLGIWQPQRAAVLGAGSIGMLAALALRLRGLRVCMYSRRRAPYLNSELLAEIGVDYVSSQEEPLVEVAAKQGPFDLMFEATGFSPLVFEAAEALGNNGVLVLSSVTGGDREATVPADRINKAFVLGNKVMVGTVNAARQDFERGRADLLLAEARYPGWLTRLLTTRIDGLENYQAMLHALEGDEGAIKVFVQVAKTT